jgi:hypothetical protein
MKRFISCLVVASMMGTLVPAWADEQADPAPVVSPLQKGQPAPYTGVLFSPQAVAIVIAQKDAAQKALELAVKHQADVDAAQLKFQIDTLTTTCNTDKAILQAQIDDGKRQINILNDQLRKNTGGPGAPIWIGLGFVGGVVTTILTVFAISQATK